MSTADWKLDMLSGRWHLSPGVYLRPANPGWTLVAGDRETPTGAAHVRDAIVVAEQWLETHQDAKPITGVLWGQRVVRVPEHDSDEQHSWQFVEPCGDDCHHPVHAFGTPRGRQHLEWLTPDSPAVTPEG